MRKPGHFSAGNLVTILGAVLLASGLHRVSVSYQDFGGGAKLFWKWRGPADAKETWVLNDSLFHDRATLR